MKVSAAVVEELGAPFRVEELDLDEPGPGEALVRVVATGICHTDEITRHGDLPMPFPSVLGHEGAGVVEAVGAGVTAVRPGDHVVIGWPSCGTCRNCRDGEPRYCASASSARSAAAGAATSSSPPWPTSTAGAASRSTGSCASTIWPTSTEPSTTAVAARYSSPYCA